MHWVILLISGEGGATTLFVFHHKKKIHSYHYHSVSLTYHPKPNFSETNFIMLLPALVVHKNYNAFALRVHYEIFRTRDILVIFFLLLFAIESEARSGFSLAICIYLYKSSISIVMIVFCT